jgi:histidinol phosphatase-like PHP family hydrolase
VFYDFHTHTFHSDGVLSPVELINRARVAGYAAIGIADHIGPGSLERVIKELSIDCALARKYWDIMAIPGVELTHLPPQAISEVARYAKELGAWIVIIHGETSVEPVPAGTNLAAVSSPYVDILAHPGNITLEEAKLAAQNNIFLELSARHGHKLTNARVAEIAQKSSAKLLVNSDGHEETDLLTSAVVSVVLKKAGISNGELQHQILETNPRQLIEKIARK